MDSPLGLLSLPIHVRFQIYILCGLLRLCPIDLNFEGVRQRWIAIDHATRRRGPRDHPCRFQQMRRSRGLIMDFGLPPSLECFCPQIPLQLLSVSRTLHDEISSVMYGANQFKVSPHKIDLLGQHLEALWVLSPKVWSVMHSLHIDLSGIDPLMCVDPLNTRPMQIINSTTHGGSRILMKWTALCENVLCHIPAYGLKLCLTCNVSDAGTAVRVVEPLMELQKMSESAIYLCSGPDKTEVREIARRAALQLTKSKENHNSRTPSPSWNDLPREIRLEILSHTDLVDRYKPFEGDDHAQRHGLEIKAGKLLPKMHLNHCCRNCTWTLGLCCCPFKHGAFSTTCTCPGVRSALFRVSRLVHLDTTEIFFSRNRLILSGDFAASRRFLFNLPSTATRYIKTIDLEVSFHQLRDMRNLDSQTARDWECLVASVASLLQLPKLWLSIDAGRFQLEMLFLDNNADHDYSWVRTSYARLFDPLYQHLKGVGLQKFHVFLCWWLEYEYKAEREVMGPDYNSGAEGKPVREERLEEYPHIKVERHRQLYAGQRDL